MADCKSSVGYYIRVCMCLMMINHGNNKYDTFTLWFRLPFLVNDISNIIKLNTPCSSLQVILIESSDKEVIVPNVYDTFKDK